MPSLVIHTPDSQLGREGTQSFEETFRSGVGSAYALNSKIYPQIHLGCRVVLLCKDRSLRAEGQLVHLEPAIRNGIPWITGNYIPRYNVHVKNFEMVPYKSEALNKNGVAVI